MLCLLVLLTLVLAVGRIFFELLVLCNLLSLSLPFHSVSLESLALLGLLLGSEVVLLAPLLLVAHADLDDVASSFLVFFDFLPHLEHTRNNGR